METRAERWPTWAIIIVVLQAVTLIAFILPWIWMTAMGTMMMGGMMQMPMGPMPSQMPRMGQ